MISVMKDIIIII